ncbi:hypothetical protein DE146DRAFT_746657 [Phaeosphaeria sp. MPI-PUGE-AT-0046c]|nr:hypothetical protein DE146DRAFT_746657 [Phaeosphaeria sp. MPI-PUGE-AT-0046c]
MDYYSDESAVVSVNNQNFMPPKNPRVPLSEALDLSDKLLKVKADQGNDAVTMYMHQDVLIRNSEYFKRVIKPGWANLREDPDVIDMGPTHSVEETLRDFDSEHGTKSDSIWIDLATYKRCVLHSYAAVQRDAPDSPCVEAFVIIYDGTPEGSPARRLLVDMYAYGAWDSGDRSRELDLLPHEALGDVMRANIKVRRENPARAWTDGMEAYE